MATATYNLNCTKGAVTDSQNRNSNVVTNPGTNYLLNTYHNMYLGFQGFPSSLGRKRLLGVRLRLYYRPGIQRQPIRLCNGNFTASNVTYNNHPAAVDGAAYGYTERNPDAIDDQPAAWQTAWIDLNSDGSTSASQKSLAAKDFVDNKGLVIYGGEGSSYFDAFNTYVRGGLSDSSAIYVQISYNDSVDVTSVITPASYPFSSVNPKSAQKFTWNFERSGSYRCYNETWTQQSATLFYREQGTSTWTSIAASGTTRQVSIPANTLKTTTTYEWYLQGTDNEGTTTTSSTMTFTTVDYTVTPVSYPSGNVNPWTSHKFTWKFGPNGETGYAQTSAKLYWKKSTASSWTQISVSGSTKSLTVASGTFPEGFTIQWYLQATDASGKTTTSDTKSFVTPTSTVSATTYPSGNSVNNATSQLFDWHFASAAGDYPQSSAKLYWRVSGASTWNEIAISNSTTSKTVPAYTFPPDSTIQWYLQGTDAGGTTTSTSVASFKTLPFTVTPTNYPNGSNVDTRSALVFEYTLQNADGRVLQNASVFYWRVSGASTWNSLPATHSSWSRTIAANTFPTASTIQWKIQVTDRSGQGTAESSVYSFNTVSTSIAATVYPSGNNVNSGAVLPFQWKYNSAVGEYAQSSAVFYWRKATTDPWTSISISGATQGINVPANTFPSASTIYWYVSGTDTGGHTSSTSSTSFKTASTQITPQSSPTSGYRDPRYAIPFSWYFASAGGSVPQGTASLFWKVSTDENYTEIQASGTTQSITVAANTFPVAALIDWYLSGTDMWGVASTSEVYQFSTAASTAYATCVSPVGSAEDSAKPITLVWTLENADGTDPTRVLVSWKLPTEGSLDWHTLIDSSDPITSCTAPAYTFPAGEIQWKVQATNRDGVAGPESLAAFVSLRAPDPPEGLTATDVPITTISWQSDEQQAYEITIDGTVARKAFGIGVYQWTVPEPLEDGVHVISVRVQSSFGLWSDPATTTIDVSNEVPAGWEDLSLSGDFGVDAVLSASGASDADGIEAQWYRDGKRIGTTAGRTFTDRFVLGEHSYFVEIWDTAGNYARSNTVTGTMSSQITRIAPLAGGNWVELRLSERSAGIQNFSWSRTKNLRHALGAGYPVLELSGFEDLSGSYNCAFKTAAEAAAFEGLRGQPVILKSRGDRVVIGAFAELSCSVTDFYVSYTFSIQQIAWEDFVHD